VDSAELEKLLPIILNTYGSLKLITKNGTHRNERILRVFRNGTSLAQFKAKPSNGKHMQTRGKDTPMKWTIAILILCLSGCKSIQQSAQLKETLSKDADNHIWLVADTQRIFHSEVAMRYIDTLIDEASQTNVSLGLIGFANDEAIIVSNATPIKSASDRKQEYSYKLKFLKDNSSQFAEGVALAFDQLLTSRRSEGRIILLAGDPSINSTDNDRFKAMEHQVKGVTKTTNSMHQHDDTIRLHVEAFGYNNFSNEHIWPHVTTLNHITKNDDLRAAVRRHFRASKQLDRPGKTIDWVAIKKQNPALYNELAKQLELVERKFRKIAGALDANHMFGKSIKPDANLDEHSYITSLYWLGLIDENDQISSLLHPSSFFEMYFGIGSSSMTLGVIHVSSSMDDPVASTGKLSSGSSAVWSVSAGYISSTFYMPAPNRNRSRTQNHEIKTLKYEFSQATVKKMIREMMPLLSEREIEQRAYDLTHRSHKDFASKVKILFGHARDPQRVANDFAVFYHQRVDEQDKLRNGTFSAHAVALRFPKLLPNNIEGYLTAMDRIIKLKVQRKSNEIYYQALKDYGLVDFAKNQELEINRTAIEFSNSIKSVLEQL